MDKDWNIYSLGTNDVQMKECLQCWTLVEWESITIDWLCYLLMLKVWHSFVELIWIWRKAKVFDKLRLLTGQDWVKSLAQFLLSWIGPEERSRLDVRSIWEAYTYERHLSGTSRYEYEKHMRGIQIWQVKVIDRPRLDVRSIWEALEWYIKI